MKRPFRLELLGATGCCLATFTTEDAARKAASDIRGYNARPGTSWRIVEKRRVTNIIGRACWRKFTIAEGVA